jgi:serine-protein kinase ATM
LLQADAAPIHACRRIVRHKPAFAELVLPLAFSDLALHHADDARQDAAVSGSIAHVIAEGLLPACTRHPKAMKLLLRCLNHLRGLRLDAIRGNRVAMRGDGINNMNNNTNDSQQRVMQEVNAIKSWRKVYWVDLDYLQLAAAAVHCRAYFSALLYVEEWCKSAHPRKHLRLPNRSENPQRPLADAQLLEIYSKINEPDGLYAVAQSNDLLSQLRRSEREGDWASVLVTCDLAMQLGGSSTDGGENAADAGATMNATNMFSSAQTGLSREAAAAGIMRALSNMGASSLLATATQARHEFLQNTTVSSSGLNTAVSAHHASMLMSQWTPLDPGNGDPEPSDASIAAAVAALASGSAERCTQAVSSARRSLVAALATAGLESAGDVNPALVRLQMLQEISEAWDLRWPDLPNLGYGGGGVPGGQRRGSPVFGAMENNAVDAESQGGIEQSARFQHVVDRWRSKEIWAGNGDRYSLRAPLQHLRLQLLRILRAPGAEAAALEEAAVTARKTRHFGKASEYLLRLRRLFEEGMDAGDQWARKCEAPAASWRVEEAKLLWARGQPEAALSTLMALLPACNAVDQTPSDTIWPTYLHALAGKWKAATQRESSTIIYRDMMANVNHVQPSVWSQQPMMSCRVMYRLATYADSLYRGVEEHMSSSDWSTAQQVLATKKQDLERLNRRWAEKQRAGQTKIVTIDGKRQFQDRESMDLYTSRQKAQQAIEQDEEELNATIKRRDELLLVAFNAHIRSLIIGDSYDLQAVFRVIQVWLAHGTHGEIVGIFGNYIPNVASRKLLPLVYQIASRLSASREGPLVASGFQSSLQNLLVRLGTEHPFHTLPHILALKNGNRGTNGLPAPPSRSGAFGFSADEDRLKAAELVLEAVSASGDRQNAIARDLEAVTDEYIRLAAAVPAATKAVPAALRRILM